MHQLKGTDGELARRTELTRTHKHRKAWANACARYVLIPVVSVFVLVIGLVAALLAPGTPATLAAPLPVPPPPNADVPELSTRPVVLLGTAGLRWSDVSQTATPTLAQLAETWAVGNVAVHTTHTTTCPADGWLTVAAGARASDLVADRCRALDGVTAGRVDGWDDYLQAALGRDALPGRFGETLTVAEVPVAGIGPGAAIALARTDGTSPERWVPRPDNPAELTQAVADALKGQTRIVIVDLGVVHDEASAAQVDVALRAALDGAGAADVLVVSLADRPGDGPGLQLIAKGQPGVTSPALLTSASTRQAGLVVTDDVTATLLGLAGMDGDERPAWATGKTIRRVPGEGVAGLVDAAEHASAVRPLVPQFRVGLVAVTSVLVLAVALAWFTTRRVAKSRPDASRWVSWHRRGLRWLTIAGLGAAALPASLLVANLVPWWRAASPPLALGLAAAVVATGIVELALAGPWRRWPAGPAAAVAAVTVAVFVVDVLTGSRMHLSAVLGTQTLVTEYFYGLTTTTFTLTATATAVLVAALAVPLVRSGRRTWAAALGVAAAVGLVVLATVAVAGFGTDAGVGVAAAVAVIGVPLVLAVGTGWLARLPGVATPRSVATPGSADEPASDTSGTGEADRSERRTAALAAAAAAVVALVVTLMLWSAGDVTPQASLTRLVTTVVVVVVAALALAGAAVAVSARRGQVVPPQLRKITVALAVLVGCAPAGALLAGLSRWWAATTPTVVAAMWWAVATASVAAAAWLMSRASTPAPGRLAVWAAALTWLTLTVDQIAGARLAPGSVLVDLAGTYVLAGVGLAAGLGRHLRRNQTRTGKVVALSAVLAVGVVTVEVVGWSVAGQVVLAAAFAVVAVELVAPRRANLLVAAVVALVAVALAGGEGRLAAVVLAVLAAATLMAASTLDHTWRLLADDPPAAAAPAHNGAAVIVATAGALVSLVLLAQVFVPALPQPAGSVTSGRGTPALSADAPVVVVGVSGVGWDAVNPTDTPTLWRLLDAAPAGAVVPGVTGPSRQCPSGGWLAISSGRNVLTGTRSPGVPFSCLPWDTVAQPDGSAVVVGFEELVDLQTTSEYRPHLGAFGQALASSPACTTAVGPRAGLALATPDGTVTRYRPLEAALEEGTDAFDCPLTLVDAGSGAPQPDLGEAATTDSPQGVDTNLPDTTDDAEQDTDPAYQGDQDDQEDDTAAVRRVDQTIGRLLAVIPDEATVLVVDTGPDALGPGRLGVALTDLPGGPRYLTSAATRWNGVFRLLDLPVSLLGRAGVPVGDDFSGAPMVVGDRRPADATQTVSELVEQSTRDQALRGTSLRIQNVPLQYSLLVLLLAAVGGPLLARWAPAWLGLARRVADGVLLVMAAMPVGVFAMTATRWWQTDPASQSMWLALVVTTVVAAGCVALVPLRRLTTGPGLLAGIGFVLLTVDALAGTPLHRGSPLGPAVTQGGRFYGFGNPTYSLYVVAALVSASVLGGLLVRHGRRVLGAVAAGAVCAVAFVVDLWPSLGADVGGGLVLAPTSIVVVLGVLGARLTWRRLFTAGVVGVALVAAIGVLDWRRPQAERTHLGAFVQRVVDGSAWEIVSRKLGYAVDTISTGSLVGLTAVLLVFAAVVLWLPVGWRCAPWERLSTAWPLARPTVVAMLLAGVAGALTNDYGVRVVTLMFSAAVPLLGMLILRSADDDPTSRPAWWAPAVTACRWAASRWAAVRTRERHRTPAAAEPAPE